MICRAASSTISSVRRRQRMVREWLICLVRARHLDKRRIVHGREQLKNSCPHTRM
jgi:hypothetical protein